jgi:hypothetical protein
LARITQLAVVAGVYAAPNAGVNPQYDVYAEAQRWLVSDWRRGWEGPAGEISSHRSRVGVLLAEASRRDDHG